MTNKNDTQEKHQLEKNWDKNEYLKERLNRRPRSFYIDKGNSFLNISYVLAILSLLMAFYTTYKVVTLPKHTSYHLNGVDGKIYQNNITPDKAVRIRDAILEYRAEKERQAKAAQQKEKN